MIEEKIGTEEKGPDTKLWGKNSQLAKVDFNSTEWVYTPIIQSGGQYDLKVSASSNDQNLTPGVILASLGVRYKSYCSSMGRTFLISPNKVCLNERTCAVTHADRAETGKLLCYLARGSGGGFEDHQGWDGGSGRIQPHPQVCDGQERDAWRCDGQDAWVCGKLPLTQAIESRLMRRRDWSSGIALS